MRLVLCALILLLMSSSGSIAQVQNCDVELFKHQESESSQKATHIVFLELVNINNYEQIKQSFKGSWAGPYGLFKSSFNNFKEKRDEYKKDVRYNFDETYSRNYAVSTLKSEGLEAYKACLETIMPSRSIALVLVPKCSVDSKISFDTIVKSPFDLEGKLTIEVLGGRLITSTRSPQFKDSDITVKEENGLTSITIGKPRSAIPALTFERLDICTEFRATPRYAKLPPQALIIPPKLSTKIEKLAHVVSEGGEFKASSDGFNGGRFVAETLRNVESYQENVGPANEHWEHNGNVYPVTLCLCATGKHVKEGIWPSGRCVMPTTSEEATIGQLTGVEFQPSAKPTEVGACQRTVKSDVSSPYEVCFRHELHATKFGSCNSSWNIVGTLMVPTEVFVANEKCSALRTAP